VELNMDGTRSSSSTSETSGRSAFEETLLKPEGRVLSTLEADGSRRWIQPRLSKGRYWQARRIVAYGLIAVFTLIPFLKLNGKPLILLDIVNRRFTLFGYTFLPTDTLFLALFMVGLILSVFAFTAILGRVWCGWACPQTVYMEFVYRPIERLLGGRAGVGGKPKRKIAGWRAVVLYTLYLLISFYLANTFLAYFVGVENLKRWVLGSPLNHPVAFTVVAAVTLLMMFDFAFFREQLCIIACPYGRLQSVLLDRQSLIVSYDASRGEPRGKVRRDAVLSRRAATTRLSLSKSVRQQTESGDEGTEARSDALPPLVNDSRQGPGDCVDCGMCVQVCPTGIDIRDGLQVECVACTQCIDACDAVMDKIGTPRGLIRYSSQAAMAGERSRIVRPRVVLYAITFTALLTLLTVLIVTKSPVDLTVLRNIGRPFNIVEQSLVENALHLKITNRTDHPQIYRLAVSSHPQVKLVGSRDSLPLAPGEMISEPVRVLAPFDLFRDGALDITLRLSADDGTSIERPYRLLGPVALPTTLEGGSR
jgi:polyferredoxin